VLRVEDGSRFHRAGTAVENEFLQKFEGANGWSRSGAELEHVIRVLVCYFRLHTAWMPLVPPNQQCQSTEGTAMNAYQWSANVIMLQMCKIVLMCPRCGCVHRSGSRSPQWSLLSLRALEAKLSAVAATSEVTNALNMHLLQVLSSLFCGMSIACFLWNFQHLWVLVCYFRLLNLVDGFAHLVFILLKQEAMQA